jgi:RNA recognition motif-containing protein
LITYGLSVDVNEIIENYQGIRFNGHQLVLRRTLPMTRPMFERIMVSNELLISLKFPLNDEEFNEKNLRNYFCKYGSIISCRIVIIHKTFLIGFAETHCVDTAIIDEPHYYNNQELILQKYASPNRIGSFRSKEMTSDGNDRLNKFPLAERIRRLKHIIETFELGYEVELKLMKSTYQEKILKYMNMIEDIRRMKNKNQALKLTIEDKQRMGKSIRDLYRIKIEHERNRVNELIQAIDSLNFY